jgi:hypothetical protein
MSAEAALTPAAARAVAPELFPERTPPTKVQIDSAIEKCLEIQRRAVTFDKRPFAALLLAPDNETVLLSHQSVDQVNHAEVCRQNYTRDQLKLRWGLMFIRAP